MAPVPWAKCSGCGTTAYSKADLVGDLCPACAFERDATAAAEKQLEDAQEAVAHVREAAKERQQHVEAARKPAKAKATATA